MRMRNHLKAAGHKLFPGEDAILVCVQPAVHEISFKIVLQILDEESQKSKR